MMWQDFLAAGCIVGWIIGMVPALYVAGRYDLAERDRYPERVLYAVLLWPAVPVVWGLWRVLDSASRAAVGLYRAGVRDGGS